MSARLQFWLGLLLGVFTAFRLRPPKPSLALSDFADDAFVACNRAGKITKTNTAARALFGSDSHPSLRYLTGQPVSPGQYPLERAALSRKPCSGTYRFTSAGGFERIVEVSAKLGLNGGAAALFRDVTALHESNSRSQTAAMRQNIIQTLCRRLGDAQTAGVIGQAVTEETYALLGDLSAVQVRLWTLNPLADTLTCVASCPDDLPKRPKTTAQAEPATMRFDVRSPELWQLYIARKPFENSLPLVTGGVTIGHLSVTPLGKECDQVGLEVIASMAALALSGVSAKAQTAVWAAQFTAVREITGVLQAGRKNGELADLVAACVKRLAGAVVCTLSVPIDGELCVLGQALEDDLLSPKTPPNDLRLHGKAIQKAFRTQKLTVQTGIANPSLEAGPWRAFAGSSGCHTLTALPLVDRCGVLAVYTPGDVALPDTQIKFLKTMAALFSVSLLPATAKADGAD